MPVHTLQLTSTAARIRVQLRSSGTWVRAPGRALAFRALAAVGEPVELAIDDRVVHIARGGTSPVQLTLQLATAEDRVTLQTWTSGDGVVTVRSAVDARSTAPDGPVSDGPDADAFPAVDPAEGGAVDTLVLFLVGDARPAPPDH